LVATWGPPDLGIGNKKPMGTCELGFTPMGETRPTKESNHRQGPLNSHITKDRTDKEGQRERRVWNQCRTSVIKTQVTGPCEAVRLKEAHNPAGGFRSRRTHGETGTLVSLCAQRGGWGMRVKGEQRTIEKAPH